MDHVEQPAAHHGPHHSQTYNIQLHGYPKVHGRNEGLFICAELLLHAGKRKAEVQLTAFLISKADAGGFQLHT
jgi:hypothetical protein